MTRKKSRVGRVSRKSLIRLVSICGVLLKAYLFGSFWVEFTTVPKLRTGRIGASGGESSGNSLFLAPGWRCLVMFGLVHQVDIKWSQVYVYIYIFIHSNFKKMKIYFNDMMFPHVSSKSGPCEW